MSESMPAMIEIANAEKAHRIIGIVEDVLVEGRQDARFHHNEENHDTQAGHRKRRGKERTLRGRGDGIGHGLCPIPRWT